MASYRAAKSAIQTEAKFVACSLEEAAGAIVEDALKTRKCGASVDVFAQWHEGRIGRMRRLTSKEQRKAMRGEISMAHVVPGRSEMHIFHPSVSPDALQAAEREITVPPNDTFLGTFTLAESNIDFAHKNKYGRDYDRPDPDSPAYARP
jgi:hypothetical protein